MIRNRGRNRWQVVVELPRGPETNERRRKWVTVHGRRQDAQRREAELNRQLASNGGVLTSSRLTLGEYLTDWLRDHSALRIEGTTARGYATIVNRHLIPKLGNIRLASLTAGRLEAYYAAALVSGRVNGEGGLSRQTVLHHHRALSLALGHAVRLGVVERNVAEQARPPSPVQTEMRALNADEAQLLIDAAEPTPFAAALHLAIYTGLRRSELCGLRWSDIDLELGTLRVVRTLIKLPRTGVAFKEPKTDKSRRQIALSHSTVVMLAHEKERQRLEREDLEIIVSDDVPVLSWPDGSPIMPDSLSHAVPRLSRQAGLGHVRLHDLRHTHATLMLTVDVHPKVVQERLGHGDITTTLRIYSHVMKGLDAQAADAFDQALSVGTRKPLSGTQAAGAYPLTVGCQNGAKSPAVT